MPVIAGEYCGGMCGSAIMYVSLLLYLMRQAV